MIDATGVPITCPRINDAINYLSEAEVEIEAVREANSELRRVALEALDRVGELEGDVEGLEDTITTLRVEILEFNLQESY